MFWTKAENRRKLFEQYALEKGRDPLDANFWYSLDQRVLLEYKVLFISALCSSYFLYNIYLQY